MRITVASYGSTGDLLPLVALAVGLRAAGHQVVTVADQAGAELAARHGLEFHALAGRFQDLMEPGRPAARAVEAGHFTWKSLRGYDAHDQARLALIQQVAQGSDVVMAMPTAHYHALAVARDIGARPVLAVLQPLAPTHAMTPAGAGLPTLPRLLRRPAGRLVERAGWMNAKGSLNDARRALGQAPIDDPTRDAFTLCAWSPALVPQPDDWPSSQFLVTGRWHLPTENWEPDPALTTFLEAGDPPVYVGLGSMQSFTGTRTLLDALFAALAPRRVIVAADPATLGDHDLPGNVHRIAGFCPPRLAVPAVCRPRPSLRRGHRPRSSRQWRPLDTRPDLDGPTILGRPPPATGRSICSSEPAQAQRRTRREGHHCGRVPTSEASRKATRREPRG